MSRLCNLGLQGQWISLVVVLMAALAAGSSPFLAVAPADAATKPQAPIEISLSTSPSAVHERMAEVTLHVRPLVDAPTIRVAIILPDGVAVVTGNEAWEGALAKGESRDLRISIKAPDREAYVILGSATIQYPDGAHLGGRAAVTVRPQ